MTALCRRAAEGLPGLGQICGLTFLSLSPVPTAGPSLLQTVPENDPDHLCSGKGTQLFPFSHESSLVSFARKLLSSQKILVIFIRASYSSEAAEDNLCQ